MSGPPREMRRHTLLLGDKELALVEKALRVYVDVLRIQVTAGSPQHEADLAARVASVTQAHFTCKCPVPPE